MTGDKGSQLLLFSYLLTVPDTALYSQAMALTDGPEGTEKEILWGRKEREPKRVRWKRDSIRPGS